MDWADSVTAGGAGGRQNTFVDSNFIVPLPARCTLASQKLGRIGRTMELTS